MDPTAKQIDQMARCLLKWFRRVPMYQHEIATVLGCSRTRIDQIEKQAMAKIRAALEETCSPRL